MGTFITAVENWLLKAAAAAEAAAEANGGMHISSVPLLVAIVYVQRHVTIHISYVLNEARFYVN